MGKAFTSCFCTSVDTQIAFLKFSYWCHRILSLLELFHCFWGACSLHLLPACRPAANWAADTRSRERSWATLADHHPLNSPSLNSTQIRTSSQNKKKLSSSLSHHHSSQIKSQSSLIDQNVAQHIKTKEWIEVGHFTPLALSFQLDSMWIWTLNSFRTCLCGIFSFRLDIDLN